MIKFSSTTRTRVHVHLQGATPFTEIYVIDATFKRIASLLGRGEVDLWQGTYTFRFQEGEVFREATRYLQTNTAIEDPDIQAVSQDVSLEQPGVATPGQNKKERSRKE